MTLNGTWKLDPTHSEAGFTVRHAGISKVRGRFTEVDATATHDGEKAVVEATIQAASFNSNNPDRDAHIRSADFLDVEVFPTLDFKGAYTDGKLAGDLTIHGVTKPIEFDVEETGEAIDAYGNARAGFEAEATIKRSEFGLTWNAALEAGGVLVSDKVKIVLDLSFIKQ